MEDTIKAVIEAGTEYRVAGSAIAQRALTDITVSVIGNIFGHTICEMNDGTILYVDDEETVIEVN